MKLRLFADCHPRGRTCPAALSASTSQRYGVNSRASPTATTTPTPPTFPCRTTTSTAYDKIRQEAPYHALTNAGHITYVELDGDPCQQRRSLHASVAFAACTTRASATAPSTTRSTATLSAATPASSGANVPRCHRHETAEQPMERIRRITGYLVGSLEHFNNAKRAEEHDRVKHQTVSPQSI